MTLQRVVVATSGRNFRPYVGRLPGGRKLWGGPRPLEQVWAISAILAAAMAACLITDFNVVAIFGAAAAVAVLTISGMSLIKYDGIPTTHKIARLVALLVDRSPAIVAPEELARQHNANPTAFHVATPESAGIEPAGSPERQ